MLWVKQNMTKTSQADELYEAAKRAGGRIVRAGTLAGADVYYRVEGGEAGQLFRVRCVKQLVDAGRARVVESTRMKNRRRSILAVETI